MILFQTAMKSICIFFTLSNKHVLEFHHRLTWESTMVIQTLLRMSSYKIRFWKTYTN